MYYWQSETHTPFTPEGDWDEEREKYGSYDGKIKPIINVSHHRRKDSRKAAFIELGSGVRKETVNRRLRAGWSIEDATTQPAKIRRTDMAKTMYIGCEKFTFAEFAHHVGLTYSKLYYKLRKDGITKTHWQEQEVAQLIENWYSKGVNLNGN